MCSFTSQCEVPQRCCQLWCGKFKFAKGQLKLSADMLLADCRKEEDVDPEQIRKDIERLQLIKQKRLECSLQNYQTRPVKAYLSIWTYQRQQLALLVQLQTCIPDL